MNLDIEVSKLGSILHQILWNGMREDTGREGKREWKRSPALKTPRTDPRVGAADDADVVFSAVADLVVMDKIVQVQ